MSIPQHMSLAVNHKYETNTAIDTVKAKYITMAELCSFFGMEAKRVKDLISLHKSDGKFMPAYKVSAGNYLFKLADVETYIQAQCTIPEKSENKDPKRKLRDPDVI